MWHAVRKTWQHGLSAATTGNRRGQPVQYQCALVLSAANSYVHKCQLLLLPGVVDHQKLSRTYLLQVTSFNSYASEAGPLPA
jgi:hypothetical protein